MGRIIEFESDASRREAKRRVALQSVEQREFAVELGLARNVWRKHRDLVEAERYPEEFLQAYIEECNCTPDEVAQHA